jgi:hypothetical protein
MPTKYKISSAGDAWMSRLDGEEHTSLAAAKRSVRQMAPTGAVIVAIGGCDGGYVVYESRSDAYRDRHGAAGHLVIASIAQVFAS